MTEDVTKPYRSGISLGELALAIALGEDGVKEDPPGDKAKQDALTALHQGLAQAGEPGPRIGGHGVGPNGEAIVYRC